MIGIAMLIAWLCGLLQGLVIYAYGEFDKEDKKSDGKE